MKDLHNSVFFMAKTSRKCEPKYLDVISCLSYNLSTKVTERIQMAESRKCKACTNGIRIRQAFEFEGRHYPERREKCLSCNGTGIFNPPDPIAIEEEIRGRKGLRSQRPKSDRAYYVWRLARFHGGKDMTMPVMASVYIHGDPFVDELNKIADDTAKKYFGTDIAAAKRWGRALGNL